MAVFILFLHIILIF